MPSLVGFALLEGVSGRALSRADERLVRALRHRTDLKSADTSVGGTRVIVWGRGSVEDIVRSESGRVSFRIGDPSGATGLSVSIEAGTWTIENDWAGSVPVFWAERPQGVRVVSTLEPMARAAAGIGPELISPTDVYSLLTHGYYLGSRTLYEGLAALQPDSVLELGHRPTTTRSRRTLTATEDRWNAGWDDLADELQHLTQNALGRGLEAGSSWDLPLSGGMDSRLIAAVGNAIGADLRTWTYGPADWRDVIYARRVATMLRLEWRRVPLTPGYLTRANAAWADWFGSSLHFHGHYQFPLLDALGTRGDRRSITTGFSGDPLGGAQTKAMMFGDRSVRQRFTDKWSMWPDVEACKLVRFDGHLARAELEAELANQAARIDGELYQQMWILFQTNHVARFSTYQPSLYRWWSDVSVPFVDDALAQFVLSLPRSVLDDRRLQIDAFRRAYPALATVPGTYSNDPAMPSGRHYAKKTVADMLPRVPRRGPLAEFAQPRNTADQRSLQQEGPSAVWPINDARNRLDEWVNSALVDAACERARAGSLSAMARIQAVQTLALALLDP